MITRTTDLIDKLGGTSVVADMLGVGPSAVSNYRETGFPGWTHLAIVKECRRRRIQFAPELFERRHKGATNA